MGKDILVGALVSILCIALVVGQKYDISIEYYENTSDAVTKLLTELQSATKQYQQ